MSEQITPIIKLKVKNVRCIKDLDLDLDHLTVLVGKNDTGKSTILECLRDTSDFFNDESRIPPLSRQTNEWTEKYARKEGAEICLFYVSFSDELRCQFTVTETNLGNVRSSIQQRRQIVLPGGTVRTSQNLDAAAKLLLSKRLCRWRDPYRLDPRELRQPSTVGELNKAPLEFNGRGLADVLDRLPFKRFGELLTEYTKRIPHVEEVLREAYQDSNGNFKHGSKGIYFQLKDGNKIPASQVSDGAMLVLGYLAIFMDVDPQPLILIEEPENGIHPGQLKDLLELIKDMTFNQKRVQVVMTTHSPYLLEYVPKDCIRVITRTDAEGTKAQRFDETPRVKKMLSVGYSVGDAFFELNKEGADKA